MAMVEMPESARSEGDENSLGVRRSKASRPTAAGRNEEHDAQPRRPQPGPSESPRANRGTDDDAACSADDIEVVGARALRPAPNEGSQGGGEPSPGGGGGGKRSGTKKMHQATLSFADGTVAAQLRKDIADRDAQIEALQHRLNSVQANQTDAVQSYKNEVNELRARLQRFEESTRRIALEVANTHRQEARRWQHDQHFELGHPVTLPTPIAGRTEMWMKGNRVKQLLAKLQVIEARQRELNTATRPNKAKTRTKADPDDVRDVLEAEEEAEMRRMELASLADSQRQVQSQIAQCDEEVNHFVKEINRIRDEDASPFLPVETVGRVLSQPEGHVTSTAASNDGPENEERYVLIHLLGKGGFSEVWKAFDLKEGRFVACKVHKVQLNWGHQAQRDYLRKAERELEIMRLLDHNHIMRLYDVFMYDATTFISVMEYGAGEDLDKRLKRVKTLKESEARLIMIQIIMALDHMSKHRIIHYDLKPANIIFHSTLLACLEVKVTDFGLSKVTGEADPGQQASANIDLTSQQCGTFWYLPPECFEPNAKVSGKVDIWACGIIFYQMLYGTRPFAAEKSQSEVYRNNLIAEEARKGVTFPPASRGSPISEDARRIIAWCLTRDVEARPDIGELCADPYFHKRRPQRRAALVAAPKESIPGSSTSMPPPS